MRSEGEEGEDEDVKRNKESIERRTGRRLGWDGTG